MVPATCTYEDCDRDQKAHTLCDMHYKRAWRRGAYEPPIRDMEERFWLKVEKTETCWNWTASVSARGYAQYRSPVGLQAHRYAYTITHGPIPDGLVIDHMCYNRICVNPSHLRAITNKQNEENRAGASAASSTGIRGVGWHKESRKWRAFVGTGGKYYHVGLFLTIAEAEAAVIAKRNELFTHNDMDRRAA